MRRSKDKYICNTSNGVKELIECPFSHNKIMAQYNGKKHLIDKGFENIINYDLTKTTEIPYYKDEDQNKHYVLQTCIKGEMCDLNSEKNILNAIELLANFHRKSMGFESVDGYMIKDEIGGLEEKYHNKLMELEKTKDKIKRNIKKNDFDYVLQGNIDHYINMGYGSLQILAKSNCAEVEEKEREEKGFCHYDYGNNNLAISGIKRIIIRDMYCPGYQLKVYDIAGFIKKLVKYVDWNYEITDKIIEEYNKHNKITNNEIKILIGMLAFPQKVWKIANKHYNTNQKIFDKYNEMQLKYLIEKKDTHYKYIEKLNKKYN